MAVIFIHLVESDQTPCHAVGKGRNLSARTPRQVHSLSEDAVADLDISLVIFSLQIVPELFLLDQILLFLGTDAQD